MEECLLFLTCAIYWLSTCFVCVFVLSMPLNRQLNPFRFSLLFGRPAQSHRQPTTSHLSFCLQMAKCYTVCWQGRANIVYCSKLIMKGNSQQMIESFEYKWETNISLRHHVTRLVAETWILHPLFHKMPRWRGTSLWNKMTATFRDKKASVSNLEEKGNPAAFFTNLSTWWGEDAPK
jgi:hypothetical protein